MTSPEPDPGPDPAPVPHLAGDEAALGLVPALQRHHLLLVGEVVHVVRVRLELGVREGPGLDAADYFQLSVGERHLVVGAAVGWCGGWSVGRRGVARGRVNMLKGLAHPLLSLNQLLLGGGKAGRS